MMKVSIKISRRAARIESNTAGKYSPPLISSSTWLPSFHWNVTGISLRVRERDRKDATMACDRVPWASESRRYAHRCGRAAVAASGLGTFCQDGIGLLAPVIEVAGNDHRVLSR